MKPKKSFGQNFLVDNKYRNDLVLTADLSKNDIVVEIGGGTGIVTECLAKLAGKVFVYEIDSDLIPDLKNKFRSCKNVEIINTDILKEDLGRFKDPVYKIVGSIPYQITSPLIHQLVSTGNPPISATLLVQKEVGKKITAGPPDATYLSNLLQIIGKVSYVETVPKESFWPVPKVDGAIVKITVDKKEMDIKKFQKFLHHGFNQQRKMLNKKFDAELLKKTQIDPTRRAQTLSFDEWVRIFKLL